MTGRERLVAAVVPALLAGCAPFMDFGSLTDGQDASVDAADAGDAAAAGDAGVNPTGDAGTSPCPGGLQFGYYCGKDLSGYTGNSNDLVHCSSAGDIDNTWSCLNGCVVLNYEFPDTCDPCAGQNDGTYCGSALPFVPTELHCYLYDVVFMCVNGKTFNAPTPCCDASTTSGCANNPTPQCSTSCVQSDAGVAHCG
jgi:hypothetical protein